MKNISLTLAIIMVLVFVAGCAKSQNTASSTSASNTDGNKGNSRRMPDFGQPDRRPDISGLVKSILGNEVTILKIERPNRDNQKASDNDNNQDNQAASPTNRLSLGNSEGGEFRGMGGGRPGDGRGFGSDSQEDRTAMLERIKKMSSGEEAIVIPVGIQMLKPDTTAASAKEQEPKMIEATLSDVTADKMISIWLNEDVKDRKIASFVLIR